MMETLREGYTAQSDPLASSLALFQAQYPAGYKRIRVDEVGGKMKVLPNSCGLGTMLQGCSST